MNAQANKDIAKALVREARAARLGEGHWAACSLAVRLGNARSNLMTAAEYRRQAA